MYSLHYTCYMVTQSSMYTSICLLNREHEGKHLAFHSQYFQNLAHVLEQWPPRALFLQLADRC